MSLSFQAKEGFNGSAVAGLEDERNHVQGTEWFLGIKSDAWLTAFKEMGTSVLQIHVAKFCKQPQ